MKSALIAMVLLSGCASMPQGVEMTDEDRTACAESGCSVWTNDELRRLIGIAIRRGYEAGKKSL